MRLRYLPSIFLVCCAACGPGQHDTSAQAPSSSTIPRRTNDHRAGGQGTPATATPPGKAHTGYKTNVQEDNHIHIAFARGADAITLYGHLGKPGHPVTCHIEMNAYQTLRASVEGANGPANIRFTRIVQPGGESDGPFGATLVYDTGIQGEYRLEIGTNLMADGAYEGDFVLKLQVQ